MDVQGILFTFEVGVLSQKCEYLHEFGDKKLNQMESKMHLEESLEKKFYTT